MINENVMLVSAFILVFNSSTKLEPSLSLMHTLTHFVIKNKKTLSGMGFEPMPTYVDQILSLAP